MSNQIQSKGGAKEAGRSGLRSSITRKRNATSLPKTEIGPSVCSMELLAADVTPEMLHTPCDASARRARFERHERYNAFQDGAIEWVNSPEGRSALAKARDAALARIKKRKAANESSSATTGDSDAGRKGKHGTI